VQQEAINRLCFRAAASCGRRSSASEPFPVCFSVKLSMIYDFKSLSRSPFIVTQFGLIEDPFMLHIYASVAERSAIRLRPVFCRLSRALWLVAHDQPWHWC
jgi:hypothetical protein